MSTRGAIKAAVPILVAITGWFVAPIIKAKMDGTPLDGLPGILTYWKHAITSPVPAWAVVLAIIVAVDITLIALRRRKKKANLSIIVLPHFERRWGIGAQRTTPFMSLDFQARFATTEEYSLEIVKGYLKDTKPVMLFSQIIVSGRYDPPTMVHLAIRPILANPGEKFTGRVVLVDQYGKRTSD